MWGIVLRKLYTKQEAKIRKYLNKNDSRRTDTSISTNRSRAPLKYEIVNGIEKTLKGIMKKTFPK